MARTSSGPETARVLVARDVGPDLKVPLPTFSGRSEDSPIWSAGSGAYAALADWSTVLEVAEAETAPISMVGTAPEAIRAGKIVCAVLLTKTEWGLLHAGHAGVIWSATWNHGA